MTKEHSIGRYISDEFGYRPQYTEEQALDFQERMMWLTQHFSETHTSAYALTAQPPHRSILLEPYSFFGLFSITDLETDRVRFEYHFGLKQTSRAQLREAEYDPQLALTRMMATQIPERLKDLEKNYSYNADLAKMLENIYEEAGLPFLQLTLAQEVSPLPRQKPIPVLYTTPALSPSMGIEILRHYIKHSLGKFI